MLDRARADATKKKLTDVLLLNSEELVDLVANFTVGHADVVLGVTVVVHEGEETVVGDVKLNGGLEEEGIGCGSGGAVRRSGSGTHKLELTTRDVGDVHVVGGGGEIFVLSAGEDIGSNKMDLGVTVLASLGGRHVDNLARAALDHDETVLTQSRALHREGERRTGIGGLEGDIVLKKKGRVSMVVMNEAHEATRRQGESKKYFAGGHGLVVVVAEGEGHTRARCGVMEGSAARGEGGGCSELWERAEGISYLLRHDD